MLAYFGIYTIEVPKLNIFLPYTTFLHEILHKVDLNDVLKEVHGAWCVYGHARTRDSPVSLSEMSLHLSGVPIASFLMSQA